jgi:hypothetical protein
MTRVHHIPASAATYIRYYQQQHHHNNGKQSGGALPHYAGYVYAGQRGAGLGSVFGKIFGKLRSIFAKTPQWVKTGAKLAAKQAVKTGMDVIGDAAQPGTTPEEWRQKAKQRVKLGTGQLFDTYADKMQHSGQSGKGIKRQRHSGKRPFKKRKRQRRTKKDFFD